MAPARVAASSLALLVALTAAAGCKPRVSSAKVSPAADPSPHVETVLVEARTVPRSLALSGTLEANRSSEVAADAAGKVAATFVERGSLVTKGAVIARLDVASAGLAAAQAKADAEGAQTDLALAADELARAEVLAAQGAIAQVELTRARARSRAAQQRAEGAAARAALHAKTVSDGAIRAPFDGLIAERWIDQGEYVRPDSRVVTLLDVDTLRLQLLVPESAALLVKSGQEVSFSVSSDPSTSFGAKVKFVGPAVKSGSRELVAEAVFDNREGRLRPGMFAAAKLELGTRRALVVPSSSLRRQGSTLRALVIEDGRLVERVVDTGEARGAETVVLDGLREGERIARSPTPELRDGLRAN